MINSIFPMELWSDYGIVLYNCGGAGSRIPTTYWVMENVLNYTTPNLIVIDCYYLGEKSKITSGDSSVHITLDAIPFSVTKVCTIKDLLIEEVSD